MPIFYRPNARAGIVFTGDLDEGHHHRLVGGLAFFHQGLSHPLRDLALLLHGKALPAWRLESVAWNPHFA